MSDPTRQSIKNRILLIVFAVSMMVSSIAIAPAVEGSAAIRPEEKAPCTCFNEDYQQWGVKRPSGLCDPICG